MAVAFQVDEELEHNNDDDDGEPRWVNWLGGVWYRRQPGLEDRQTDRLTVIATPVGETVVVLVVAVVVVNLPLSSAQPSHLR